MEKLILFAALSLVIVFISWRSLFNLKNHGFYSFFSWECILWLMVCNAPFWFDDPFSLRQIISWILLFTSIYYVAAGTSLLLKSGKASQSKDRENLYRFEKTTELVDTGIYRYIRHPLYGSLLLLTWGVFLKNPTPSLFLVSLSSSMFLYLTAIADEKECIAYFGKKYLEYMKISKMFIPFIF